MVGGEPVIWRRVLYNKRWSGYCFRGISAWTWNPLFSVFFWEELSEIVHVCSGTVLDSLIPKAVSFFLWDFNSISLIGSIYKVLFKFLAILSSWSLVILKMRQIWAHYYFLKPYPRGGFLFLGCVLEGMSWPSAAFSKWTWILVWQPLYYRLSVWCNPFPFFRLGVGTSWGTIHGLGETYAGQ